MPARNAVFTDLQKPRRHQGKKTTNVVKKNLSTIQEIPDEREKYRRKRLLIGIFVGLAIIIAIILAGLLPALIITLTGTSASNTAVTNSDMGASTVGNSNTTTVSSVMSASSSSSVNLNPTTVSSVTAASSSSSVNLNPTTVYGVTSALASSSTSNSASSGTTGLTATASAASSNGFSASGAVAAGTTAYYGYEQVVLGCSVDLSNITIIITVQKTVNATFRGYFSTFWNGVMTESYVDTGSQIIYTWTIIPSQTVRASGSPYTAQAQFYLSGVNQPTSADTYSVTAQPVNSSASTISGHF